MVTAAGSGRVDSGPRRAGPGRAVAHRYERILRRLREWDVLWALTLAVALVVIGFVQFHAASAVPLAALAVPMVIGNLVLPPRTLPWVLALGLAVLVVVTLATPALLDGRRIGGVVVVFAIGLVILVASFRRSNLGVAGMRSESMLVDLRDRLRKQAQMPDLSPDWYAETAMRSAGGSSFAGDFIVASRAPQRPVLDVVVVDVSGKGEQAGPRSLLLSGAFGGLLGALPPDAFLPAANDYLLQQDWAEGFATAVHVTVRLDTGSFELRSAGHPPGVQLLAGSGRWTLLEAEGPVLGLMPDAEFSVVHGQLRRGDTLLLFTDGLVETSRRDISSGIDRLIGHGERLLRNGLETTAELLVDTVKAHDDDRALLVLRRS